VGNLRRGHISDVIDAKGWPSRPVLSTCLSWSTESLIVDGRRRASYPPGGDDRDHGRRLVNGPLERLEKREVVKEQGDIKYAGRVDDARRLIFSTWNSGGVSPNVASFIGAATVRIYAIGEEDKQPTPGHSSK